MQRRVAVLGSTGSIGTQTLEIIAAHPDELKVVALSTNGKVDLLARQARDFAVRHLAIARDDLAGTALTGELENTASQGTVRLGYGRDAIVDLATLDEVDVVVNALVGAAGMRASYAALAARKTLALANKESLVVAGDLIMPLAKSASADRTALMPIDSEHGAIFQCLIGERQSEVARLWVTASGGPFRGRTVEELQTVGPEDALKHPNWSMGAKITIDSATMMNKGLEVIEAHHLFAMPYDKISVVVHPQSIIHSMVEFIDGSVKAHLGVADMRIPIQFALSFPARWNALAPTLDFCELSSLTFERPDTKTFRCLALAREAGKAGGTLPCAMNAANEVAVAAFLERRLGFLGIASCVEEVMGTHQTASVESLDQLEEVDRWARGVARSFVKEHQLL